VELIVVIVILAILAAIAIPALTGYIQKAQDKEWEMKARDYAVAFRTVLDEAYAAGSFNSGDAATYFKDGNPTGSANKKTFFRQALSGYATGDDAEFLSSTEALLGSSYAGTWDITLYDYAGSDVSAASAGGFSCYFAPKGLTPAGNPVIFVTYRLTRGVGITTWPQMHNAGLYAADWGGAMRTYYDSEAGYEVYHLVMS
jgi:type II secretory pathway pseudopilin PulG